MRHETSDIGVLGRETQGLVLSSASQVDHVLVVT